MGRGTAKRWRGNRSGCGTEKVRATGPNPSTTLRVVPLPIAKGDGEETACIIGPGTHVSPDQPIRPVAREEASTGGRVRGRTPHGDA